MADRRPVNGTPHGAVLSKPARATSWLTTADTKGRGTGRGEEMAARTYDGRGGCGTIAAGPRGHTAAGGFRPDRVRRAQASRSRRRSPKALRPSVLSGPRSFWWVTRTEYLLPASPSRSAGLDREAPGGSDFQGHLSRDGDEADKEIAGGRVREYSHWHAPWIAIGFVRGLKGGQRYLQVQEKTEESDMQVFTVGIDKPDSDQLHSRANSFYQVRRGHPRGPGGCCARHQVRGLRSAKPRASACALVGNR